jgi:hypothetical protein
VIEQESPKEEAAKPADAIPSAAAPPKVSGQNSAPAAKTLPRGLEDSSASLPMLPPSPGQTSSEKPQANFLWLFSLILIALALVILTIAVRKRKRPEPQFLPTDDALETEPVRPQTDGAYRPDPGFIEGLKRREELLKAGFIVSKPPIADPISTKRQEVVIVLPKEAFRIEDDK